VGGARRQDGPVAGPEGDREPTLPARSPLTSWTACTRGPSTLVAPTDLGLALPPASPRPARSAAGAAAFFPEPRPVAASVSGVAHLQPHQALRGCRPRRGPVRAIPQPETPHVSNVLGEKGLREPRRRAGDAPVDAYQWRVPNSRPALISRSSRSRGSSARSLVMTTQLEMPATTASTRTNTTVGQSTFVSIGLCAVCLERSR
jgi:hypothetical protein